MTLPKPNIDSLFEVAVEMKTDAERAAFLDVSCDGDLEMRRQLEQLLRSDELAGGFLEKPAVEFAPTIIQPAKGEEQAVVLREGHHSMLKMLGQTLESVPHVALRDSVQLGPDPVVRTKSADMPHQESGSRYRLDGEIARGGMGAILKGRDTDLGRDLAIKVLLAQHKDKPEVIQRFVEEAQIGGQLQHPGIAPIYELGQFADKRPFFAMKLIKGETLSKLLADRKEASSERGKFIGIFEQICQTMAYAHSRGVIHRDLKPANIMVGAFGEVQVMDWGLAKVLPVGGVADEKKQMLKQEQSIIQTLRSGVGSDSEPMFGSAGSNTQMGSVMGTPAYMPPEQALGEVDRLDERSDVFGLGAILCEVLTGQPPYVGTDGTAVFRLASRGKLDNAFSRLDGCGADADLIALTRHCLELEPADRPRDAGVLAQCVTEYLESVEVKLRVAEVDRAAQAARADAEAAQAAAERQRAEAESDRAQAQSARAQEERKRRRTSVALAASVVLLVGLASGGWLYLLSQEADRQTAEADAQRKHAGEMQTLADQRDDQRKAAEQGRAAAIAAQQIAEIAEEQGRRLLYATDIQLAAALINDHKSNASEILARLSDHDPQQNKQLAGKNDLRGFEWYYLKGVVEEGATVFDGFSKEVVGATMNAAGELVTLDGNGRLQHWNVDSQSETQSALDLKKGRDVTAYALSGDGERVALAIGDKVYLVTAKTGEVYAPPIQGRTGIDLLFSPDGRMLITVDTEIAWWDADTGNPIVRQDFALQVISQPFSMASLSTDGLTVAVGGQGDARYGGLFSVFRMDQDTHEIKLLLNNAGDLPGEQWKSKRTLSVSPNGEKVAISYASRGLLALHDTASGKRQDHYLQHATGISAIAFDPASKDMVTASVDGSVKLWVDYQHSMTSPSASLLGHMERVNLVAFAPGGKQLVSVSEDKTVRVWDLDKNRASLHQIVPEANGSKSRFSADGKFMAVSGERKHIQVRDASTGKVVHKLPERSDELPSDSLAFSPDGKMLAVSYRGVDKVSFVELWDIERNEKAKTLPGSSADPGFEPIDSRGGTVSGLAFSPNGRHLVAGLSGNWFVFGDIGNYPLLVYDVAEGRFIRLLEGHRSFCATVNFSPDGSRLASASPREGHRRAYPWRQSARLNSIDA